MTFSEKLKSIRKKSGMSQEKLAEKIGVSRQAITKWETGAGIPDIENMIAVSALFNISLDELLSNEKVEKNQTDYIYESVTEYDIDQVKRYDMNLGGANTLSLCGYDGEKSVFALLQTHLHSFKAILRLRLTTRKIILILTSAVKTE